VVVTGELTSNPAMRDIHYDNFSLTFQGAVLVRDTSLVLNYGHRYGLLGLNGSGKSTLLCAIGHREVTIPDHLDMYHLVSEVPATTKTALEIVVACDAERLRLEKQADELTEKGEGIDDGRLDEIYERLDELDVATVEKRASEILYGLGFTPTTMRKAVRIVFASRRYRCAPRQLQRFTDRQTVGMAERCRLRPFRCWSRRRNSPEAGACALRSRARCLSRPKSCCWMSRPTTWTWSRACGSSRGLPSTTAS
jgi:hypothetical protein